MPSGFLGALLKKVTKKRHIITIHSDGGFYFLKRLPLLKHLAAFTLNNCDAITVVSSSLRDRLFKLLPENPGFALGDKVHVVKLGVDLTINKPGEKSALRARYGIKTKHVILFVGRLDKIKGLVYLIQAMQEVKDSTLIIAGDGKLKKRLMKFCETLKIPARFAGFVDRASKSDYFCLCDLVVVPSITLPCGRTEGIPVVILEALAHERPVLASDVGGISEVVDDGYNGFLFQEKNPGAIAERINYLLNNGDKLKIMQENALSSSRKFDIRITRKNYEEIIDRIS
jgi:glycosyltransferase involved in cell wall biosynthesis